VSPLFVQTELKANQDVSAYFDDSLEAVCGVVFRPEFEHRLAEHLKGGGSSTDDAAWYALRNSVYASGCRAFFAKQSSVTWAEAQRRSWPYLENALSVQLELMYTPTDLMAVRALAAMVSNFLPLWSDELTVIESSYRRCRKSSTRIDDVCGHSAGGPIEGSPQATSEHLELVR